MLDRDTWVPTVNHTDAILSRCGTYRYRLTRGFDKGFGKCVFVMLNPSTADADIDDATVRRCMGFTTRWGFQRLVVVNLFALRNRDPKALKAHKKPVGPKNDEHIRKAIKGAKRVVLAWGNHGRLNGRGVQVEEMIVKHAPPVSVFLFSRTKQSEPVHPLYQRNDRRPYMQSGWIRGTWSDGEGNLR